MSVVFDFIASLNDAAPVSPMLLTDDLEKWKEYLLVDVFCVCVCVCFLLSSQFRSSSVSVVLLFNASLNDVAPASPVLFPVVAKRKEKGELLMDVICVSSFFCIHSADKGQ